MQRPGDARTVVIAEVSQTASDCRDLIGRHVVVAQTYLAILEASGGTPAQIQHDLQ